MPIIPPHRLRNRAGITLTELIIASALVGLVMLGLISSDFATRAMKDTASKSSVISDQITAAMLKISRDAFLTTGDEGNSGLDFVDDDTGGTYWVCFRYNVSDIYSYSDDLWTCYYADTAPDQLKRCSGLAAPDGACAGAPQVDSILSPSQRDFFDALSLNPSAVPPLYDYIKISLSSKPNNALPKHTMSNPEYTMETQIALPRPMPDRP